MPLQQCFVPTPSRRRHFWATQPDACGTYQICKGQDNCNIPGLELSEGTFSTDNWVRSLLLNMFNTVARKEPSVCGSLPGMQGGHWSESYVTDNTYIGTKMYYNTMPARSLKEAIALLNAAVSADAYKLVTYGIATSIAVETEYQGGNKVLVTVFVIGPDITEGKVNLSVKRLENAWVWES